MQQIIYLILNGVNCCNLIAWFFMGFFWRFSRAGRIAAGEKIERGDMDDDEWNQTLEDEKQSKGY